MMTLRILLIVVLSSASPCLGALTQRQLSEAILSPPLGAQLPLDATFTEAETGHRVSIGQVLNGKPGLLVLVDYSCRFICGTTLAIAAKGLSDSGLRPGIDFQFFAIGINPRNGLESARNMKSAQVGAYPELEKSAKFLVGGLSEIESVTKALGYKAVYDSEADQYAHPTGAIAITPEGHVAETISGVALDGSSLRSALQDAKGERVSGAAEGIRLLCYGLSPLIGAHASAIQVAIAIGALLTALSLFAFIGFAIRRERRWRQTS